MYQLWFMSQPDIAQNAKTDVAPTYKAMQQCINNCQKGTTASTVQGLGTNSRCSTEFLCLQSFLRSLGNSYKTKNRIYLMFNSWAIVSVAVGVHAFKVVSAPGSSLVSRWLQHFQRGPDGCQESAALVLMGRKEQSSGAKWFSLAVTCNKSWSGHIWEAMVWSPPTAPATMPSQQGGGEVRRSWTNYS